MPLGFDVLANLYQLGQIAQKFMERKNKAWKESTTTEYTPEGIPSPVDMYGGPGVAAERIGVLLGKEKLASDLIKRGLKEPWFHGTHRPYHKLPELATREQDELIAKVDKIRQQMKFVRNDPSYRDTDDKLTARGLAVLSGLQEDDLNLVRQARYINEQLKKVPPGRSGFSTENVGQGTGQKIGEPLGISITRDPRVAEHFGTPLRVGVDVHSSQLGDLLDPEVLKVYRNAYEKLMNEFPNPRFSIGENLRHTQFKDIDKDLLMDPNFGFTREINERLSKLLQEQGLEGVRYNPNRYAEYEARIFDPKKVIPLGELPRVPFNRVSYEELDARIKGKLTKPIREEAAMRRYYYGSSEVPKPEARTRVPYYTRASRGFEAYREAESATGQGSPSRISEMLDSLPHMKAHEHLSTKEAAALETLAYEDEIEKAFGLGPSASMTYPKLWDKGPKPVGHAVEAAPGKTSYILDNDLVSDVGEVLKTKGDVVNEDFLSNYGLSMAWHPPKSGTFTPEQVKGLKFSGASAKDYLSPASNFKDQLKSLDFDIIDPETLK